MIFAAVDRIASGLKTGYYNIILSYFNVRSNGRRKNNYIGHPSLRHL